MNQKAMDELARNVVEARTENVVLQSLCAMLVVELAVLKSPDGAAAEATAMMARFSTLADAFGKQGGGLGKVTAPIATEVTNRIRVIVDTTLRSAAGKAA